MSGIREESQASYDRVNRAVMKQARDTRLPRASGKVDLVEAGLSREVFLIYTTVYR